MPTAQDEVDRLLDHLRSSGARLTQPRRAIVAAMLAADDHPTAEDLAAAIHTERPEIHRSTVYRNLDALESAGIVDHVHLGHGRAVYHLVEDRHLHLVCDVCARVTHVPEAVLGPVRATLLVEYGFRVDSRHFPIPGLCTDCAATVEG